MRGTVCCHRDRLPPVGRSGWNLMATHENCNEHGSGHPGSCKWVRHRLHVRALNFDDRAGDFSSDEVQLAKSFNTGGDPLQFLFIEEVRQDTACVDETDEGHVSGMGNVVGEQHVRQTRLDLAFGLAVDHEIARGSENPQVFGRLLQQFSFLPLQDACSTRPASACSWIAAVDSTDSVSIHVLVFLVSTLPAIRSSTWSSEGLPVGARWMPLRFSRISFQGRELFSQCYADVGAV